MDVLSSASLSFSPFSHNTIDQLGPQHCIWYLFYLEIQNSCKANNAFWLAEESKILRNNLCDEIVTYMNPLKRMCCLSIRNPRWP